MGFVESFLTLLIFIIIIAFVLFAIFSYFLGWLYPRDENIEDLQYSLTEEETQELNEYQEQARKRRKWIGIFSLVAIAIIMATSSVNAFMGEKIQ